MKFISITLTLVALSTTVSCENTQEDNLSQYLNNINHDLANIYNEDMSANYNYEIYGRNEDIEKATHATEKFMELIKHIHNDSASFKQLATSNSDFKRQLDKLPKLGYNALNEDDHRKIEEASANMSMIYQTVKLCSYRDPTNCDLTLIPGIQDSIHNSDNLEEVKYYWLAWKNKTGAGLKESFQNFVDLYRKTAQLNGFSKPSRMWFKNFEEDNVLNMINNIMEKMRPLFIEFHGHVRFLLRQKYGEELIPTLAPYPQHISEVYLGDAYLYEDKGKFEFPYAEVGLPNITERLIGQGYTSKELFDVADDFFTSIGMPKLPQTFLETNAIEVTKPEQKILGCWNKAWNFHSDPKVRLSYCPDVTYRKLLDMHEVLSNVHYYQSWKDQPTVYQTEPLPNFSDAIGKVFSTSASTPKHLKKLGIISEETYDSATRINRLYLEGMQQVFLLPVLYVLDKYRISILDGEVQSWDNCAYWDLNSEFIGAMPPVDRHPEDFDAPSKLLIGVDDEYSSLIVSIIAQYQILKHFCEITGEYKPGDQEFPLDNCDLSDHPELGAIVQEAMRMGSSKPWRDVLQILTGTRELDVSGFMEYFDPLFKWLQENNNEIGAEIGWTRSDKCH